MKLMLVCLVAGICLTCFLCNVEAGRKNENHKNGFKRHPKGPKNKDSSSSESDSDSSESSETKNGDGDFDFSGDNEPSEGETSSTEIGFATTEYDVSGTSMSPGGDYETTGTTEDKSEWFTTWGSSSVPEFTASAEGESETIAETQNVNALSTTPSQAYPEYEFTETGQSENDASKATEVDSTPLTTEFIPEEKEN